MRGYDRVLRLAWTVADLADVPRPGRAGARHRAQPAGERPMSGLLGRSADELLAAVAGVRADAADPERALEAVRAGRLDGHRGAGGRRGRRVRRRLRGRRGARRAARGRAAVRAAGARGGLRPLAAPPRRRHGAPRVPERRPSRHPPAPAGRRRRGPLGVDDLGVHAPLALWCLGDPDAVVRLRRSIALVGARAATGYGERVATDAAAGLADRGFAIVSGAAYGIDGTAHRAVLASGGTTVAVLAGGLDRFYPSGHEQLLKPHRRRGRRARRAALRLRADQVALPAAEPAHRRGEPSDGGARGGRPVGFAEHGGPRGGARAPARCGAGLGLLGHLGGVPPAAARVRRRLRP